MEERVCGGVGLWRGGASVEGGGASGVAQITPNPANRNGEGSNQCFNNMQKDSFNTPGTTLTVAVNKLEEEK